MYEQEDEDASQDEPEGPRRAQIQMERRITKTFLKATPELQKTAEKLNITMIMLERLNQKWDSCMELLDFGRR